MFVIVLRAAFGVVPICVPIWIYEAAPKQYKVRSALSVYSFKLPLQLVHSEAEWWST